MNDRFDQDLRERITELVERAPQPRSWDEVIPPVEVRPLRPAARPRLAVFAGVAASLALLVGAVAWLTFGRGDDSDPLTTLDEPTTTEVSIATTSTSTVTSSTVTSSTVTSSTAAPDPGAPIAVSYRNPPPSLEVQTILHATAGPDAVVLAFPDGVVGVLDRQLASIQMFTTGEEVSSRSMLLNATNLTGIAVGGLDQVIYVVRHETGAGEIVAIALAGAKPGEIVARAPVSMAEFGDAGSGILGLGPDGVFNRRSGTVLIGYVDSDGRPLAGPHVPQTNEIGTSGQSPAWNLAIESDPAQSQELPYEYYLSYTGPETAVRAAMIGVDESGGDADPVIAALSPGGQGRWYSLPDDWRLADAQLWGTLLARHSGSTLEIGVSPQLGDTPGRTVGIFDLPTGELNMGPSDVIATHTDGDLYLHPGALSASPGTPILLTAADPLPPVGGDNEPRVSIFADLFGPVDGSLIYTQCCSDTAVELMALPGAGATPVVASYLKHAALSPDRTRLAISDGHAIGVVDLRTRLATRVPYGDYRAFNAVLTWANDTSIVALAVGGSGQLSAELSSFDARTLQQTGSAPGRVSGDSVWSPIGRNSAGRLVMMEPYHGQLRTVDPVTLAEDPAPYGQLPLGTSQAQVRPDDSLLWVVDNELWFQPPGGEPRSLGAGFDRAWFPTS